MTRLLPDDDSPLWIETETPGASDVIRWIPLSDELVNGIAIGIDHNCQWVYQSERGLTYVSKVANCVPLLPILQLGREEAHKRISSAVSSKGLATQVSKSFPLSQILSEALKAKRYWASLAIAFLDCDEPLSSEYEGPLSDLIRDKRNTTQKARHAAVRLLTRLRMGE